MEYLLVGCRSLLVLVFLASVVSKLRGRDAYAAFVTATSRLSPRLPSRWPPPRLVAAGVVATELAIVALLVAPATVPVGFGIAAALLLAFTTAILAALRRGERATCRCFGASEQPLGYAQVVRNLVLLVVACLGGLASAAVASAGAAPELAGALVAVAAGAVAGTIVVIADDIAELFRPV